MEESFWLESALRRLRDAQAVYRHRALVVAGDFTEAMHVWVDQRGRRFAQRHLAPQLVGVEQALRHLQEQLDFSTGAVAAARACEADSGRCHATLAELEVQSAAAARLTRTTHSIAGRVKAEAGAIDITASGIDAQLASLLA